VYVQKVKMDLSIIMAGTDRCKKVLCGTFGGTCGLRIDNPKCCHSACYQSPQAVTKLGLQAVLSLHSGVFEDFGLLGRDTASLGKWFLTFLRS
jgi:hypothetical protein